MKSDTIVMLTKSTVNGDSVLMQSLADLLLRVIVEDAMEEYALSTRDGMIAYMREIVEKGVPSSVLCAINYDGFAVGVLLVEQLSATAVKVGMLSCSPEARSNTAVTLMATAVSLCRYNGIKDCYTTFTPANPPHAIHWRMGFKEIVSTYRTSLGDAERGLKKWLGDN